MVLGGQPPGRVRRSHVIFFLFYPQKYHVIKFTILVKLYNHMKTLGIF